MSFLAKLFGSSVPVMTATELSEKLKFGRHPVVLDVRQPEEYRQLRIAGAKLIPLNELHHRMSELPQNREIVCVCASGNRSRSASKILMKAGYTAFDMQGGMLAWRRAKLPVQKG